MEIERLETQTKTSCLSLSEAVYTNG